VIRLKDLQRNMLSVELQQVKAGVSIQKQYMIEKMTNCCKRLKNMIFMTYNAEETGLFFNI
jgi:hypothetical protein